ncbi:transposase (plasmid) [Arsenophonus nasoniae]|nr:transposase [Arsenophonus nasoniae]WGM17667.1 transposase [Arsenophonus nasoniae]
MAKAVFQKKGCRRNLARAVIRLLRHSYDLINPGLLPGLGHIRDKKHWRRYLRAQYGRYWKVHFAKKNERAWHSVKYLGRYLKRPPVSASKLRHYRGVPLFITTMTTELASIGSRLCRRKR